MSRTISTRHNALLWTVQAILALLFLFAGGFKQTMSPQALAQATGLPGAFMRFIGLAEIVGGLGLVLPGILGIKPRLTPLAAAGLVVIMIGATTLSAIRLGIGAAILPAVVGILLVVVIGGRREHRVCRFRPAPFDVTLKASHTHSLHT